MKIVLISIYGFHAVNIRYLASYLSENGHDPYCIFLKNTTYTTNVTNAPTNKEYELLLEKIEEIKPDIIGVSLFCCSFKTIAKELITRLKVTKLPVIIGGIAPTADPQEYMGYVDYLCRGEGEYALLELLNSLEADKEPKDIPGVWYKKDNKIIENNGKRLIDINKLPPPYFGGATYIDNDSYQSIVKYKYPIFTSRGCPFTCTYCVNNYLKNYYKECGSWLRKRSVENVIKELLAVKEKIPEVGYIHFIDDDFIYNYEWLKDFCKEYKEKIGLPFSCLGSLADCDEKRVSLIVDAGCNFLQLGMQSGSERVRKEIFNRMGYSNEDIVNTSKMLSKYKLFTRYDVIIDNPFETKQDKEETLGVLLSLRKPFTLEIFSLAFYPHTKITEMALERNLIKPEEVEGSTEKKVIHDWRIDPDIMTSREDIYYSFVFQLIDSPMPRVITRLITKIGFFRKYPKLLAFSRYMRSVKHILNDVKVHRKVKIKRSMKEELDK